MKIEIWSDIACPFCYIGKRKLEKAIQKLPDSSSIQIEWKSFQLNPDLQTNENQNTLTYLSQTKGWTLDQTLQMTAQVAAMGREEGLNFDFEHTIVANTKQAHRLLHFAKEKGKQDELKERLFQVYFEEGKNIDKQDNLIDCAEAVGLAREEAKQVLDSASFDPEIDQDVYESRLIGVQGVPFFVFDRKYGISGAQPDEVFDRTLQQALQQNK
ncbi:MAG: DsbA family oxidoreductase [Algoriphagus sp.]